MVRSRVEGRGHGRLLKGCSPPKPSLARVQRIGEWGGARTVTEKEHVVGVGVVFEGLQGEGGWGGQGGKTSSGPIPESLRSRFCRGAPVGSSTSKTLGLLEAPGRIALGWPMELPRAKSLGGTERYCRSYEEGGHVQRRKHRCTRK